MKVSTRFEQIKQPLLVTYLMENLIHVQFVGICMSGFFT